MDRLVPLNSCNHSCRNYWGNIQQLNERKIKANLLYYLSRITQPPPAKIFDFLTLKDAFLSPFQLSPFPFFFPFFPQQSSPPPHHHIILQNIYPWLIYKKKYLNRSILYAFSGLHLWNSLIIGKHTPFDHHKRTTSQLLEGKFLCIGDISHIQMVYICCLSLEEFAA